jgi:hypothetical protein
MNKCKRCFANLRKAQKVYCSNQCQIEFQYENYIEKWLKNSKIGGQGIKTKNISRHIKRYLVGKSKERCSKCGWKGRHPLTNKVPLEVDHIDGNPENNNLKNLQLLCPNCHSLTPHFRNLNKGNGRRWRNK